MENKSKILIVDDAVENIDALGALLKDYRRQFALNGEKALVLAKRDPKPDLILLDVIMPGIDGHEVCKILKSDEDTMHIPIIFLTSKTDREDILMGFEIGAQDYITKPFDARELMARVRTQLKIVDYRKKLQSVNEWLEEQVDQRTKEIQEANSKLERAMEEIEKLDANKSEFLNIISHEIRTPLNGIIGSLSILRNLNVSEETIDFIDILDGSVERLEKFSLKALEVSALKMKGPDILKRKPTDIFILTQEVIDSMRSYIEEKNITLKKNFDGEYREVNIDPRYFRKAFYEVMINAVTFSPNTGTIEFYIKSDEDTVSIEILDEGDGFTEDLLSNIALMATSNHVDKNPGLGLYFSRLVADNHGGKLNYSNRTGSGARVYMEFAV